MPIESWLIYTLGIMLLGSIVALEIRDILSAIIAIGIVGLAVSAAFLFLQAPDLAIVQFLFEIFALVILVRAFIGKKAHADTLSIHKVYAFLVALALVAFFFLFTPVFRSLPPFGEPLLTTSSHYLTHGPQETGAANIVASIVLDYRAYDTMGEVTVLFTAILGALTVLRMSRQTQKGREPK
ncbi:MAG TPA: DUF4040 domain-containing protein [bacterium]|nr:DUF4040 domain-containing protein [bacterium]HPG47275.1 DUF4040 domain-containing protein [bacterium]HPM99519.1 DUF4040 domain-containing protein [bacterium]